MTQVWSSNQRSSSPCQSACLLGHLLSALCFFLVDNLHSFCSSMAGSSVLLFSQLSSVSCDLIIQDQSWLVLTFLCLFSNPYFSFYSGYSVVTSRGQSKSIVLYCFLTVSSCSIMQQIHFQCVVFCSVRFVDLLSLYQISANQQYSFTPLSL